MRAKGLEPFYQEHTGLILDPYFAGTKATWAFQNWPEVKRAYNDGCLAIGTIDSFLISKFSGGVVHVTEPSNASRTLCFDLKKHVFDPALCKELDIPIDIWPEVLPSGSLRGLT